MTIREALAEGSAVLAAAGIENPGLDSSLLLAEVLNISRSSLMAAASQPLTEESRAAFDRFIKRRLAGECTAYIVGRKEFYGLDFQVNPAVLVPRPDTETLVEAALIGSREWGVGSGQPLCVLDLCTGCGAIAIALKHAMPELEVWAADISAEALEIAKANALRLLPDKTIHFYCGNLFDVFSNGQQSSLFPMIISNPPYIPTAEIAGLSPEVRREPMLALNGGSDGLDIINSIISRAPEFLCPGGSLLLEADPRQMERIASRLLQAGFTDIHTRRDLSGKERVISGKKP
ncbi:MAG: peptide chain release factor N(5)-glutamine methyltransferase [Treponema sp.]|jgi:release factor glutamine methyltransferase|nr:peptide chain release factor N(5)-glutamine methyltransferase [Treponema sp.]